MGHDGCSIPNAFKGFRYATMNATRIMACGSAAAAASLAAAPLLAATAIADPNKNIQVVTHVHGDVPQEDTSGPQCKKVQQAKGVDGIPFMNTGTVGTMPGDNYRGQVTDLTCVYALAPDFSSVYLTGTETGTITIDGCGTGTAVLEFEGTVTNGHDQLTARLQPGNGTGDLKGASGTFTSEGTSNPDGSADETITGTVHCSHAMS